jgi:hypothetical protein
MFSVTPPDLVGFDVGRRGIVECYRSRGRNPVRASFEPATLKRINFVGEQQTKRGCFLARVGKANF